MSQFLAAAMAVDRHTLCPVNPNVFGSFLEHLGRAIYGGIYDPEHPLADADGFRSDVMAMVNDLGVAMVRYPGGNFVSGYRWEDGVGPIEGRPRRLDVAWHAEEPNRVGLNEFVRWARKVNAEVMAVVNLGTRGIDAARSLVEYANHPSGSYWSDLRIQHGFPNPHRIKVWGLGNEMDGPWQIGHKSAVEYGRLAREAGKAMKAVDPTIELVAAGSSSPRMRTFPEWDATVADLVYDTADYLSLHFYHRNPGNDTLGFLAGALEFDAQIEAVKATCDYVRAKRRSKKFMRLSVDEWNVWATERHKADLATWGVGSPREEYTYSLEDALLVGSLLLTMLRHADRVQMACLAQLVNVAAPIVTEPGGKAWRQPIYFPFQQVSRWGRGEVLFSDVQSPEYATDGFDRVPFLDALPIWDPANRMLTVFAANRSPDAPLTLRLDLRDCGPGNAMEHWVMTGPRPDVANSADDERVAARMAGTLRVDQGMGSAVLPPLSWNALRLPASISPR